MDIERHKARPNRNWIWANIMTLFDDAIALGLPFNPDGSLIRPLRLHEQPIYSALKIKYLDQPDKDAALAARPDMAALLSSLQIDLDNIPDTATVKAEYVSTMNTLDTIIGYQSPTNAQVIAAVKFLAQTLRLILRILARVWKAQA